MFSCSRRRSTWIYVTIGGKRRSQVQFHDDFNVRVIGTLTSWRVKHAHQIPFNGHIRAEVLAKTLSYNGRLVEIMVFLFGTNVTCHLKVKLYLHTVYAFSRRFYLKRLTSHPRFAFYQFMHFLGIKPVSLALLVPCATVWATEMQICKLPWRIQKNMKIINIQTIYVLQWDV